MLHISSTIQPNKNNIMMSSITPAFFKDYVGVFWLYLNKYVADRIYAYVWVMNVVIKVVIQPLVKSILYV